MMIKKYSILLLVLSLALLVSKTHAEGGPVWPQIIDLGAFADTYMWGSETKAYCINELGQVAGYSKYPFPYEWMPGEWDTMYVDRAFLWLLSPAYSLPAGLNNLGLLDANPNEYSCSTARGMNDLGQVVGQSTDDIWPPKGFCWTPGIGMEMLMFTGDYPTMILDINNNGVAVGYGSIWHYNGPVNEAVSWQKIDGTWQHFRSGCLRSQYHAINDSGAKIGQIDIYTEAGYLTHAHFWWGCEAYDLGALYDWYNASNAADINNKFQIVGHTRIGTQKRACLWENLSGNWDDWTITDLGTLPGALYSEAQAISDNSKIIGVSDGHAVLWEKENGVWKITDLNDIPLRDTTWELEVATDINSKKQIVGYGRHAGWIRGFRLTLNRWIKPRLPLGPGGPLSNSENDAGCIVDVYPNPFNQIIEIRYQITDEGYDSNNIRLKIFDASGRIVKNFSVPTAYPLLSTSISWDGTDNAGKNLPAGIYLLHLQTDKVNSIKKIIKSQ